MGYFERGDVVALNYEDSDSPLNCTIDAERLVSVAKQAKVKDITRLYDTDRFGREGAPTADNVRAKIKEIGARTGVNDYFVLCFSGHGDSEENPEAPSGVDRSKAAFEQWKEEKRAALREGFSGDEDDEEEAPPKSKGKRKRR